MLKSGKRSSAMVPMENRCGVCDTKLTLYPKDFAECPHCQKKVCRQCWSGAWAAKAFSSEKCAHMIENDGLTSNAFTQKENNVYWDWPRIAFAGVLTVLAAGVILFLLNLFVF
jgi:hypothetical protein